MSSNLLGSFGSPFVAHRLPRMMFKALWVEEGEARDGFMAKTKENLALLERRRFFGGDQAGYLDIAASALSAWLPVLEEMSRAESSTPIGEEKFLALCRNISDVAVKACLPSREQLVDYYVPKMDGFVIRGKSLQK